MYLRHTTRVKDGKAHMYWRLVRSVRVGRKVHQQTVAQLGELDAQGRAQARALARTITGGAGAAGAVRAARTGGAADSGPPGSPAPGTRPRLRGGLARLDAVA